MTRRKTKYVEGAVKSKRKMRIVLKKLKITQK